MNHPAVCAQRAGVLALAVLVASACVVPLPKAAPAPTTESVATVEPAPPGTAPAEPATAVPATVESAPTEEAPTDAAPAETVPTEVPPSSAASPAPEYTLASTDTIVLEETVNVIDESNPLVVAAAKDLGRRLGVGLEAITLVSYEEVVWPDGAMGCPQPGMVYPQVQVDGAIIRLEAGGVTYTYHSGGSRPPFLCEKR